MKEDQEKYSLLLDAKRASEQFLGNKDEEMRQMEELLNEKNREKDVLLKEKDEAQRRVEELLEKDTEKRRMDVTTGEVNCT